ncbi:hypothetical protein R8510_04701 [Ralstonia chuxiongensis]|nr:hypothetical protein R8510_04701 [Ralstonia chuxiongensis]
MCCQTASSASAATDGSPIVIGRLACSPAAGCLASPLPSPNHPPLRKTTATITSGSPANPCAIARFAAKATWCALKAVCPISCRGPHLTRLMFTDQHHPRVRLPSSASAMRSNLCRRFVAARECPRNFRIFASRCRHSRCLDTTGSARAPVLACDRQAPSLADRRDGHSIPIDATACGTSLAQTVLWLPLADRSRSACSCACSRDRQPKKPLPCLTYLRITADPRHSSGRGRCRQQTVVSGRPAGRPTCPGRPGRRALMRSH